MPRLIKYNSFLDQFLDPIYPILSDWIHTCLPFATPNLITTVGNLCRTILLGLLYTHNASVLSFVSLFSAQYLIDGLDGAYARKFNMGTLFGEMYDHIGDQVFSFLFVLTITLRYSLRITDIATLSVTWFANCLYLAADHGLKNDMNPQAQTSFFFIPAMSRKQLEFLAANMSVLRFAGPATMNLVCGCVVGSLLRRKNDY